MAARAIAIVAVAGAVCAACDRSDERRGMEAARPLPAADADATAPPPARAVRAGESAVPEHDRLDPSTFDAAAIFGPVVIRETRTVDGGPLPPDPDDAVKDPARVAAARCFRDLPPDGPAKRTATITVNVIATGTVSRAEVRSPDTTEPAVLACLKGVGAGLKFAEKPEKPPERIAGGPGGGDSRNGGGAIAGLRTYAIDVTVLAAAH
jgi:hypothetical protein